MAKSVESRTEQVQIKLRSQRYKTRIPGCREGSNIPVVMEMVDKTSEKFKRLVADQERKTYKELMGSIAGDVWPDGQ